MWQEYERNKKDLNGITSIYKSPKLAQMNSMPLLNEKAFISLIPLPETSPHDHLLEPILEKTESKMSDFVRSKKKEGTMLRAIKTLKSLDLKGSIG